MSGSYLIKVYLDFNERDKDEVLRLIEKKGWGKGWGKGSIIEQTKDFIELELYDYSLEESDFEEFKEVCYLISSAEYELLQEGGVFWEGEKDKLEEEVRRKIRKNKKEKENENNKST